MRRVGAATPIATLLLLLVIVSGCTKPPETGDWITARRAVELAGDAAGDWATQPYLVRLSAIVTLRAGEAPANVALPAELERAGPVPGPGWALRWTAHYYDPSSQLLGEFRVNVTGANFVTSAASPAWPSTGAVTVDSPAVAGHVLANATLAELASRPNAQLHLQLAVDAWPLAGGGGESDVPQWLIRITNSTQNLEAALRLDTEELRLITAT